MVNRNYHGNKQENIGDRSQIKTQVKIIWIRIPNIGDDQENINYQDRVSSFFTFQVKGISEPLQKPAGHRILKF